MTLDRRTALILLALIVAVGAWLRFHDLGAQSLWIDEAASWAQSKDDLWSVITRTAADNYPPLANLLMWASLHTLGDSEFALRLPSALLGTLEIAAIYALAVTIRDRWAGVIAALLLCLSPYHIWYSHEARMYALLCFSATVFGWGMLRYLSGRGPWPMVLGGIALIYSHPYGALTWVAIVAGAIVYGVTASITRTRLLATAAWQGVILVAFAPWALVLALRAKAITEQGFWIPFPTPMRVFTGVRQVLSGNFGLVITVAGCAFLLLDLALRARNSRRDVSGDAASAAYLLCWSVLPTVFGIVISALTTPVFLGRYVIGSLPPVLTLAAVGISRAVALAGSSRALGWRSAAAATCIVAVACVFLAYRGGSPQPRADWRGFAKWASTVGTDSTCVVVAPNFDALPLQYYMRDPKLCVVAARTAADIQVPPDAQTIFFATQTDDVPVDAIASRLGAGWSRRDRKFQSIMAAEFTRS